MNALWEEEQDAKKQRKQCGQEDAGDGSQACHTGGFSEIHDHKIGDPHKE